MKPPPDRVRAQLRQPVATLDTPALVIDLDALERNVQRMAAFAKQHKIRWRPHGKAHKSADIALSLMQAGAVGACVQKTSEAEALANGLVNDIYISNEVIDRPKLLRVARLAHLLAAERGRLAIAVDSLEGVQRLAAAIERFETETDGSDPAMVGESLMDVFVEIDVGQGRCGVEPGHAAVALAVEIARHSALRFAGLQAYHGGAQHVRGVAERQGVIEQAARAIRRTRDQLEAAGYEVPLVTGGGTGSFALEAATGVWGEMQPGSFLFMDADYGRNDADPAQPAFEHSLFVKTQVMSRGYDRAICDAGHKSHAVDSGMPRVHSLGRVGDLVYSNGGDEHGILRAADADGWLPEIGETLWLIPGHCDPTINLHDQMFGVRGGLQDGVVERIIPVDARGAVS
ncbi:MAG: DSD1 family PLP-dependent enzyme [Burkholderiales bacterium]